MQAPPVAEAPQIQAPEAARPDQPKRDGNAFAKVLERSLAPAKRDRPTPANEPAKPRDKPEATSTDSPAKSADPSAEVISNTAAISGVQPTVVLPMPANGIGQEPTLIGKPLSAADAAVAIVATTPVIAVPTEGAAPLPVADPGPASANQVGIVPGNPVPTNSIPAIPTSTDPGNQAKSAADATGTSPVATVLPTTAPAAVVNAAPVLADHVQAKPAAAPVAVALASGVIPTAAANPRATTGATKLSPATSDPLDHAPKDDAATLLPVIATSNQTTENTVVLQYTPPATASASSAPTPTADDAAIAPTAAMPQPSITPATAPATAAGAALGNRGKATPNAKDAVEPLDLQKPSSSTTPTMNPAATAAATNAPVAVGQMREAASAPPAPIPLPNPMERAVAQQVERALVQHLPNGERMMVLRLTPPELGTVRIELIEHQGVLRARLHAEDDGVRLALERTLPQMRQELRASDAPIRELTLTDQAQFQRPDGQTQRQQDQQAERRQRNGDGFSLDVGRSEPLTTPRTRNLGARVDATGVDALA